MTEHKNFSGRATPAVIDVEYRRCNFSQPALIERDGRKVGVRLFPGDDTPRTFVECNLMNCEPPPGSTLIDCNTALVEVIGDWAAPDQGLDLIDYGRYEPNAGDYVCYVGPIRWVIRPAVAIAPEPGEGVSVG